MLGMAKFLLLALPLLLLSSLLPIQFLQQYFYKAVTCLMGVSALDDAHFSKLSSKKGKKIILINHKHLADPLYLASK